MAVVITLPPPQLTSQVSLEEALARRRSVREFTGQTLTQQEVSQLLWATQGITSPEGYRTAPSAGGLLALEIYVASSDGFFHYLPEFHRLRRETDRDLRPLIFRAGLQQEALLEAPVVFVIAAVYRRIEEKYGRSRSPRYVHMEVGHAAQNLLLQAVSLGLGAVVMGAFEDAEVQNALSLPEEHRPLYLIPVGRPVVS